MSGDTRLIADRNAATVRLPQNRHASVEGVSQVNLSLSASKSPFEKLLSGNNRL